MAYRIYVTDALRITTKNTGGIIGGEHLKSRYVDIIGYGKKAHKVETRSAEQIKSDMKAKIKILGGA